MWRNLLTGALVVVFGMIVPLAAATAQTADQHVSTQQDPSTAAATDPAPAAPQLHDATDPGNDDPSTLSTGAAATPWPVVHAPPSTLETPAPTVGSEAANASNAIAQPAFAIGEVRARLPQAAAGVDASAETKAISAIYAARRDDAIWVTPTGLNAKGASAIAEIKQAGDWGLDASDYVLSVLPEASNSSTELPRDQLADAELKISFAVLAYARDARGGRITDPSKQLSSYLDRLPQTIEPRVLLEELAESGDPGNFLRLLHPQHPQFEKLRQKYLQLRSKAASAKAVVQLPSSGPKLVPGIKHLDVALLRQRLGVGVAQAGGISADETVYDAALEEAVKAYQSKQGQKADGIVGKNTRASLNDIDVPDPNRLIANMEQWRWMPADMGQNYVTVNIPEFMVRVIENGKVAFEERVVTGQLEKQTPVFSDQLETIYFHPRWNVPESIKVLELYPNLARGGGSFQRQGLKLMRNGHEISPGSVDWSQADIRNFDVYQPSGESNVLGLVKFAFPNKHGVYMHDTSSKGLFEEPSRPFSHGCMRVRNPLHLAQTLLALDKGWPASRVSETLDSSPDEVPVQIDTKIPVHITYFTDVIDDIGEEHIFKDVYGHEQRIKLALAGRFSEIDVGPDHLAPVAFHRDIYASSPDDWGSFFGTSPTGYGAGGSDTAASGKKQTLGNFLQSVFGGFDSPQPAAKRRRKASQ